MSALFEPVHTLYHALMNSKPKEKIDMILEPLQAMIQLSLLSICPVGTKLRIYENILYLHSPTMTQPLSRWYHADKKDDLYFLYAVIKRFIKWYNPTVNKNSPIPTELYQLITVMSVEGLNQLFKTYSSSDSNTVIHVIQMYKNLLEYNNDKILLDEYLVDVEKQKINIDEVFESIIQIYDPNIVSIIYPILLMVRDEVKVDRQKNIISGFTLVLENYHCAIKDWIKMNLALWLKWYMYSMI